MPHLTDLILPVAMAVAAGLVGAFALMRRMALASDAMSHVALPGIGLAIALQINPVLGGFAALVVGVLLVWAIEQKTSLPTEAVIGVIFSAALALGSMLTSGEELIEALFGAGRRPGTAETVLGTVAAIVVAAFILRSRSRLVIALISPDLAATAGINVRRINLLFLLTFAVAIALGLRYLGVLLIGSLLIIPAAAAKHLAGSLNAMQAISVAIAVGATVLGSIAAPL
ncbi:MAG: metal ABC transporter permease, partial [Gemmatimonadales bacterium]